MPVFKNTQGHKVKYLCGGGYIVDVIPDTPTNRCEAEEHRRINYPAEPWVMEMADRCVHSDNVQLDCPGI